MSARYRDPDLYDALPPGMLPPRTGTRLPTRKELGDLIKAIVTDAGAVDVSQPMAEELAQYLDALFAPANVVAMRKAINAACEIIETADARNLAVDGPAGGSPPQMSLKEWRRLYVTLDKARRAAALLTP